MKYVRLNFRDKYLKEYRVKNKNITILETSKVASHSYPGIKHLDLSLKANLTEEKQPPCSTRILRSQIQHRWQNLS